VGREVPEILGDLVQAAGGDTLWAACGVVCLDEVDKLCTRSTQENGLNGRDVAGRGVQRELLGLLSAPEGRYRSEGPLRETTHVMPLNHVLFVLCGAFAGLAQLAPQRDLPRLGFGTAPLETADERKRPRAFTRLESECLRDPEAFVRYGMMPELVGRLSRIVPLQPLGADELHAILRDTVLQQYRREFSSEGVTLELEPSVEEYIVSQALVSQNGARGLHGILRTTLERVAYECLGQSSIGKVTLALENNRVVHRYAENPGKSRDKSAPSQSLGRRRQIAWIPCPIVFPNRENRAREPQTRLARRSRTAAFWG
jgi:ATP-dependent Clp protease ATP-binding subunit ClpX